MILLSKDTVDIDVFPFFPMNIFFYVIEIILYMRFL